MFAGNTYAQLTSVKMVPTTNNAVSAQKHPTTHFFFLVTEPQVHFTELLPIHTRKSIASVINRALMEKENTA
jgi:hypothetical protein